ncbi:MAG: biotin-dependent carboxyltransferase family protein [Ferruginibacter sp.]
MNLKEPMSIKIIKPGMFATIQDLGRNGYRSVGIGPGGAMDFFAASIANFLVGNDAKCPVIEMHFPAAEILFEEDALVSITGGDFDGYADDEPVGSWKPFLIKKNKSLWFKKPVHGVRIYLSIHGGIASGNWLNSFSTHTKVKAGGHKGRPLLKGDIIPFDSTGSLMPIESFPALAGMIGPVYQPANIFRCIAGPEWNLVNHESQAKFSLLPFSITNQSDRMGYRLKGRGLALQEPVQLVSSPVDSGTIQLLPNGQLIVLMADHQTTGGYPRIANVIGADLPKLAQSPIHSELKFKLIGVESAEEFLFLLYQTLESIKDICKNYYDAYRHQL